ncbi:MAG: hypothetical protein M1391_10580, partial [Bacteroidetes bacterium]|nr:hypothetical protein [Bacteroidota bacterium]
ACDASLRKNVFLIEVETFRERLRDTLGDACDASLRKMRATLIPIACILRFYENCIKRQIQIAVYQHGY